MRFCLPVITLAPTVRQKATPAPTANTRALPFMTDDVCDASTDRSGSATVMSRPSTKQAPKRSVTFPVFVRPDPTRSPIGIIDMSAPRLKTAMPTIMSSVHTQKITAVRTSMPAPGTSETASTAAETGSTENTASRVFFRSDISIVLSM